MNAFVNLPKKLKFLIEPAKKFGIHQFAEQIDNFLSNISKSDLAELTSVAKQIKLNGNIDDINAFLDQHPIDQFEETALIFYLIGLLDAAGLSFEKDDWNTVGSHMSNLQKFGSYRIASERMHAARFLAEFGFTAKPAIPLLETACFDEDERVQVWARYALIKLNQSDQDLHLPFIKSVFSRHDQQDDLDCYDSVGTQAYAALSKLGEI